ncbi:MAG: PilZ domain-containing protein [Kofleriaceae bacterium]
MYDHPDFEARAAARVELDSPVMIRRGDDDLLYRSRDLSATGLFLWSPHGDVRTAAVGEQLELLVHAMARPVRCRGEVARVVEPGSPEWASYPTGMGVRIVACAEADRAALDALLSARA